MGQEKSDNRKVPKSRRKLEATNRKKGIGKAVTASEDASQCGLFVSTADSPKGDAAGAEVDQSTPAPSAVPKEMNMKDKGLPAISIRDVGHALPAPSGCEFV